MQLLGDHSHLNAQAHSAHQTIINLELNPTGPHRGEHLRVTSLQAGRIALHQEAPPQAGLTALHQEVPPQAGLTAPHQEVIPHLQLQAVRLHPLQAPTLQRKNDNKR